ncbi:MAG: hydantoinase B/oxoprolinase family protein [Dongiaceae bacterium]
MSTGSNRDDALAGIDRQIMWNRLIAVVEEQAQTLIRTAFSTTVREAGDLSAGVFDRQGRMVAQAVTGTPGHVNSMANAVQHFIARYPVETMRPGDHYVSNDPWLTSGHLHDITVVTPAFQGGRLAALFACTCHVVDIGGRGFGPDGRQVFEEGLFIPVMKLAREGRVSENLLAIVRANVREPAQVEGDLYSYMASNDAGCDRLGAMLGEFGLAGIEDLADDIIGRSRRATEAEIGRLQPGVYENRLTMDGYDTPVELACRMTIGRDAIDLDFAGSSPASPWGINVVLNYCQAYAVFGAKCIVAPAIPNNAGSLAPFRVTAPEGSILNVQRPQPVAARHVIGQMLPDVVMGCLAQAMPGRVPAEGASASWQPQLRAQPHGDAPGFDVITFNSGGTGARPGKDGLSATGFPSGVRGMPVEATEQVAPVVIWRKEFRADSGGAGTWRGGLGQAMEMATLAGGPFDVLAMFDRVHHPARGRQGGGNGAPGRLGLASGPPLRPKGQQGIPAGDRLRLELPGGGGYGDPQAREVWRVAEDVRNGLVSREAARELYGVVVDAAGALDEASTQGLRGA